MVGVVIVHQNKIIGEGYYPTDGGPKAEILALANTSKENCILLKESTLYISSINCSTNKNTPTFIAHILKNKIPKVVISSLGFISEVCEQNIKLLRDSGVEVITNILPEKERFASIFSNTFTSKKRPYVVLKYAQTLDGFLAQKNAQQFWISNSFSKRLVHKWRSEIGSILVGTNTALYDNPKLDNRLYFGKSPLRIVFDQHNRLPKELNLFDGKHNTLLINKKHDPTKHIKQIQLSFDDQMLNELLSYLQSRNISSLLVEGGAKVLQSFVDQNLWDESRIFVGNKHLSEGLKAPQLPFPPDETYKIFDDQLFIHYNTPHCISQ